MRGVQGVFFHFLCKCVYLVQYLLSSMEGNLVLRGGRKDDICDEGLSRWSMRVKRPADWGDERNEKNQYEPL